MGSEMCIRDSPDTTTNNSYTPPGCAANEQAANVTTGRDNSSNNPDSETIELLEMEVSGLNQKVTLLQAETTLLRQQLAALYNLTGQKVPAND